MKKTINWGILGTGHIAQIFADDLKLSNLGVLYGVASRSLAKAKAFNERNAAVKCYGSYEDMAKDANIDVVYIATPHTFHFENTMMSLAHDKAVLCEKPMGMNAWQVQQATNEATARGLFLMEAMWTRFIPATEKLLQLLDSEIIGKPSFIHADFGFRSEFDPKGRLFNKKLGGGSLMDIGIYPIYLSLLALGVPENIKAMGRITATGVDSYCAMLFDHQRSAKAILESTFEADTPTEAIIYGDKGVIKMHSRFHHSKKLSVVRNGNMITDYDLPYDGQGYIYEIEEVNQCMLENRIESVKMPHKMSLDLIEVVDQVKKEIGLHFEL